MDVSSFFLSFCLLSGMGVTVLFYSFPLYELCFLADMGRRRCCETPTITARAGSGAGKGYTCGGKRLLFLDCEGQRHAAAAIALRAACSGIEIQD